MAGVARQGDDLAERLLRTDPRANRVLLAKLLEIMKDSKPSDSVRMTMGRRWIGSPSPRSPMRSNQARAASR